MKALPEFEVSRLAREHAAVAAAEGELTLQQCRDCGKIQYPFREVCSGCLSGGLDWRRVNRNGSVIASVSAHASLHPFFRENAPWQICSVELEAGPCVIAHAADERIESGDSVEVFDERLGPSQCVLVAKKAEPPQ